MHPCALGSKRVGSLLCFLIAGVREKSSVDLNGSAHFCHGALRAPVLPRWPNFWIFSSKKLLSGTRSIVDGKQEQRAASGKQHAKSSE